MNSTRDIVFKRCGCTDEKTGRQLAGRCPHLAEPGHGSWYYAVQVTTVGGRKARYRRGGFATREAAAAARQAILDGPADEAAAGAWTVARWLRYWLAQAEPHLRPSTAHGYRDHIDRYLIPSIGRITLADLTGKRLQACFNLLARQRTRNGTPIAASTVDRVRATLRSALNAAVREGLIASNPLAHVRLDKPVRPHPVIWTDERVEAWRRDGIRPPVAVWTLRQLITFLTGVENDRLAALWWLIALRGLRRGEAAALDRDDLDSEARELTISRQLIALPGELYCGPPKSRASSGPSPWTRPAPAGWSTRPSGRPSSCSGTSSPSSAAATPAPAPARAGGRDGRCSPTPTDGRSGPSTSPTDSTCSSRNWTCRRSGSTTCATAPPPSPWHPAPT